MDSLKQAESNHHCFSVLKLALASVVREQHEHLLWCYKSEWTSQTSGGNFITLNFFLHWRIGNMLSQKDIMCLDWFSLSTTITVVYFSKQSVPNLSSSLLSHISWGGFFHILVSNWPVSNCISCFQLYLSLGTMVKNPPDNTEDARNVCSVPGLGRFSGVRNSNLL